MKKKYQTGSHHLKRVPFFNPKSELDIDVPDGDVQIGKRIFNENCAGCHGLFQHKLGPKLHNIFGKTAGSQKGYFGYSKINRNISYQWSKQRLFYLLQNPEEVLGMYSNMLFNGLPNHYDKACLIQYLHYMRIHTSPLVKPEWTNSQFQ